MSAELVSGAVPTPHEPQTPTRRVAQHIDRGAPNTTRARRSPRVLIGRYELHHRIGSSATSEVYLATDQVLARSVVVKILRPTRAREPRNVARFREEALALARIDSPRVVAVHDLYVGGTDEHFVVMRHIIGRTLAQFMEEVGMIALPHAVRIVGEILDGLSELHGRHLVARDLKPSHVMIDWDDHVVLLGVDIVADRRYHHQALGRSLADGNQTAPIRRAALVEPDDREDLRQIGLLLLYLLTGVEARVPAAPGLQVLTARLPRPLARVIQRALATDASRFDSAFVMREALDRALQECTPVKAKPSLAVARPAGETGAPPTGEAGTRPGGEAVPTPWLDPTPTVVGKVAR
jgi:serine/threonine protein kinase